MFALFWLILPKISNPVSRFPKVALVASGWPGYPGYPGHRPHYITLHCSTLPQDTVYCAVWKLQSGGLWWHSIVVSCGNSLVYKWTASCSFLWDWVSEWLSQFAEGQNLGCPGPNVLPGPGPRHLPYYTFPRIQCIMQWGPLATEYKWQ